MSARLSRRDALAWLAYLAHEAERVGEGELADVLGVDRIGARDVLIAGRDIDDARKEARRLRVEAMRAELASRKADVAVVGIDAGARGYGFARGVVERLFADGLTRSTGDAARAMGVSADTAVQRLKRSGVVERVGRGQWRKAGAA